MCVGVMQYFLACGHSAVKWNRCPHAGRCQRIYNGEAFRDQRCPHSWCPCDYRFWACCRCRSKNLWATCVECRHIRCGGCEPGGRDRFPNFQDPRYLRWYERFVEQQEREREIARARRVSSSSYRA
ncbi:hypothetical protein F5X97DRAFT_188742 [Nemania serpens]|nr:hypothetical protein F5X97DRAFT_188742 [Nemania serpens]